MNYVWLDSMIIVGTALIIAGLGLWANNKKSIIKFIVILIFLLIIQITVLIMATQVE